MATLNPLEQKARSSFIKGVLITAIIGIAIIAFLAYQLYTMQQSEKERLAAQKTVLVLNQDVTSGELLTSDMFTTMKVDAETVPSTAVDAYSDLQSNFYMDEKGNQIVTYYSEEQQKSVQYIKLADLSDSTKETISEIQVDEYGNYYYMTGTTSEGSVENGKTIYYVTGTTKNTLTMQNAPFVAKFDLDKNTVVTTGMISAYDQLPTDDLREQEVSAVVLPTDLSDNDVVDIRLRMPDGKDYLVISKKTVTIPTVGDTKSSSTMSIDLKESEILTLSCATVESYEMSESMLYAVKYTDPGVQEKATTTYIPSVETLQLVNSDNNIVKTARDALVAYYNNNRFIRNSIDNQINSSTADERSARVQTGTSTETSTLSTQRQEYVQAMQ